MAKQPDTPIGLTTRERISEHEEEQASLEAAIKVMADGLKASLWMSEENLRSDIYEGIKPGEDISVPAKTPGEVICIGKRLEGVSQSW